MKFKLFYDMLPSMKTHNTQQEVETGEECRTFSYIYGAIIYCFPSAGVVIYDGLCCSGSGNVSQRLAQHVSILIYLHAQRFNFISVSKSLQLAG